MPTWWWVRERVRTLVNDGKSPDGLLAPKPTASFDDGFSGNSERFVRAAYHSLAAEN